MLEILKSWITTMLCTGIFFTFVKMIVPNSKLSKYIYSLIGVVTIFTLVVPTVKFINTENLENSTKSVINNIDVGTSVVDIDNIDAKNTLDKNVKNEFAKKMKNSISELLEKNNIDVNMITVIVDDNYQIQKVSIKIENNLKNKLNKMEKIFSLIKENYNISDEKVVIEEV